MNHPDHTPKDELASRVLDRITYEKVTPRPRWEFLAKNYFFWATGLLSILLGACAVAATLFEINAVDWRLFAATHSSFFAFFLAVAPFFWVVSLVCFVVAGYVNFRSTDHGYRYQLVTLTLVAVGASILCGSGLYATGVGGEVEELVGSHTHWYKPIMSVQREWWLAPQKGLLTGSIGSVMSSSTQFTIIDTNNRTWIVDARELHDADLSAIAQGGFVRVVGTPFASSSGIFHACFVFPWVMHTEVLPPPSAAFGAPIGTQGIAEVSEHCSGIRPYNDLRRLKRGP